VGPKEQEMTLTAYRRMLVWRLSGGHWSQCGAGLDYPVANDGTPVANDGSDLLEMEAMAVMERLLEWELDYYEE
jgi:hypothetical protein